jgi:hypothetical protein
MPIIDVSRRKIDSERVLGLVLPTPVGPAHRFRRSGSSRSRQCSVEGEFVVPQSQVD